jgi:NADH-quinone oxidoreductase subunit L
MSIVTTRRRSLRRTPYVLLTALLSGAIAWWAYPHLNDRGHFAGLGALPHFTGNDVGPTLPALSLDTAIGPSTAQVMLLAAAIALLVQLYSVAYMGDDPRYRSYALLIVLFLVAMVAVIATDNLFVLLVGWEVMGVCSYLLIGHHWETADAQSGAAKALLVTRAADIGLLIAILVIGQTYGSYAISDALNGVAADHARNSTLIGLLLLIAVMGKSAQVPLQTWLPDAMPGPTPITALIHAATMVAAGVFVMARLLPLYETSVVATTALAIVAAVTMLTAAAFALVQPDLKRALAWSTVSQLALMFAAVAVADGDAAVDHLISHGAFKALLFLGCGVAMHTVGSSALSAMGGLRRVIPVAFWTMTIGFAALAGLVPTVGFFSKDEVLAAIENAILGGTALSSATVWILLIAALLTTMLTAAYATRLWALTFLGAKHDGTGHQGSGHRTPWVMSAPLVLLAVATFVLSIGKPLHLGIGAAATGLALVGIALGWRLRNTDWDATSAGRALVGELSLDRLFSSWIPAIARLKAATVVRIDDGLVDSYPRGGALAANGVSWALERMQSAKAQLYATGIAVGALLAVIGGVVAAR